MTTKSKDIPLMTIESFRGDIPSGLIDFPCSKDWADYYREKGFTNPLLEPLMRLNQELAKLNEGLQYGNRAAHSKF